MYDFIRGSLVAIVANTISVEVSGVGYRVAVPPSLVSSLPNIGEELLLYVTFVVREAFQALYGFLSVHERNLFELLLDASGVGPKLALSIIGHISLSELQMAIIKNDIRVLCLIPGVGKKTAERLVIELRDKIASLPIVTAHHRATHSGSISFLGDALSALMNLGYNQVEAQHLVKKALETLPEPYSLSAVITAALQAATSSAAAIK